MTPFSSGLTTRHVGNRVLLWTVGMAVLFMAACAPQNQQQEPTLPPPGTFVPAPRNQPTPTLFPWVEGAEEVKLGNANLLQFIGRLDAVGAPSTVFAHAFSPDGTRLAGLNNEQLIVWDLISGQIVFNTARLDAQFVYYGADKSEVYTVDNSGQIRIFESDTGRAKDTLQGQQQFSNAVDYYPDDGLLALGGVDGAIKVWDVAARQSLVTIQADSLRITTVAFSPDGTRLAENSDSLMVKVWDWKQKQATATFKAPGERLALSPDGKQVAVGENDRITLWTIPEGQLVYPLNTGVGAVSEVFAYSPDGQYLINGSSNIPSLTIWDTQTGKLVNTLPGVGGDRTSAAFSAEGDLLVTSVLGGSVTLWDVSKLRDQTLNRADLDVGTRQIFYADWSTDGYLLALFDASGPIRVWGIPAQPTPEPSATPE